MSVSRAKAFATEAAQKAEGLCASLDKEVEEHQNTKQLLQLYVHPQNDHKPP
jgi:hypothetical protein